MAELTAASDPRRAALLKKAVAQSKEQLISVRFERLVELLGKDQLSRALENQTDLDQDLRALLELLMSENRAKTNEAEKARIREYLQRINTLIKQQEDIQGRTAGGDDPKRLAGEQGKLAERPANWPRTSRRTKRKGRAEKRKGNPARQRAARVNPARVKAARDRAARDRAARDRAARAKPARLRAISKSSRRIPPANALRTPKRRWRTRKRSSKRPSVTRRKGPGGGEKAPSGRQGGAGERFSANFAKSRLGGCWRCSKPASARCCKCRRKSTKAPCGSTVPAAERTHSHEIEASRLSGRESQIVVEVDKARLLLREDGTAVAFPEAVGQMRDDMQQVVGRLAQAKVGRITQGIEEDIMAALKEMIAALKKAQRDHENKKPPTGQRQARPAARTAVGRPAGRIADDPRPPNAGQYPHHPLLRK